MAVMRRWRAVAVGCLVLAAVVLSTDGRALEPRRFAVGTTSESWYNSLPVELPLALPALSLFPAGNLHVGVVAGQETARSYVRLAAGDLPGDVIGGTLVLPLVTDPTSGSFLPETAALRVCLAEKTGDDGVEGASPPAPAVDCGTSSAAEFVEGDRPAFTVDLGPFGSLLSDYGLALLPDPGVAPTSVWRVVVKGFDPATPSEGIHGLLDVLVPELGPASESEFAAPADPEFGNFDLDSSAFVAGESFEAFTPAPLGDPDPSVEELEVAQPVEAFPAAPIAFLPDGFSYPAVLLMPLALLAALGWFGSNLTRPALQRSTPE